MATCVVPASLFLSQRQNLEGLSLAMYVVQYAIHVCKQWSISFCSRMHPRALLEWVALFHEGALLPIVVCSCHFVMGHMSPGDGAANHLCGQGGHDCPAPESHLSACSSQSPFWQVIQCEATLAQ